MRRKSKPYDLAELRIHLEDALYRLLQTPKTHKPFVVVSDTITGRFVQFRGSDNESLLLDLPHTQFKSAIPVTKASAFLDSKRSGTPQGVSYRDNLTFVHATNLALRVLREVHNLPENAQIEIIEDTSTPKEKWN